MPQLHHCVPDSATPLFSLIVPTYNDWAALEKCLQSLAEQTNAPRFEVIVVDDSSDQPAPAHIRQWRGFYPLSIVRSPHPGIPAAKNHGIRISQGAILVFTDADCRLDSNCLAELGKVAKESDHSCFQLRLTGDGSSLIGQAEDLRLTMLQEHLLDASGQIRYLNTAGFAIRRTALKTDEDLFDPAATRAEDTVLLAALLCKGQAPFFLSRAVVHHAISNSAFSRLKKDVLSAYLERYSFSKIATMGVRIRMTHRERWKILRASWASPSPLSVCSLLVIRQLLRRAVTSMCILSQLWKAWPSVDARERPGATKSKASPILSGEQVYL